MRKLYLVTGVLMMMWCGCSKDNTLEDDQRTAFKNYLTGQQIPYTEQAGVYKYVSNTDREGYQTAAVLEDGGKAIVNFAIYEFGYSGKGTLCFTNRLELIADDMQGVAWPMEPKELNLSDPNLVKGVRLGLPGCREGDSVQLYLVSPLGYGKEPWGVIPAQSPLVWDVVVSKVVK